MKGTVMDSPTRPKKIVRATLGASMIAVVFAAMALTIWKQADQLDGFEQKQQMLLDRMLVPDALIRQETAMRNVVLGQDAMMEAHWKERGEAQLKAIQSAISRPPSDPSREAKLRSEIIRLRQTIEDLELQLLLGPLAPEPIQEYVPPVEP